MKTDLKEPIYQFNGKIIGYIESNSKTGEALARDFYGRIIGTYDPTYGRVINGKRQGCTRNFSGKIVGYGNMLHGMIFNPTYNKCVQNNDLER